MNEILRVNLIISRKCNLACPHCLSSSGNVDVNSEVSLEDLIKFLDSLPSLIAFKITGGEPFHPDVYDKTYGVIKYLIDRGVKSIQINTNGTFMIPEFDLNPEIVSFQVSIDGSKEVHDAIRGAGVFDKAIAFIKDKRDKGYDVETMTVITEPNYEEIQYIIDLDKELGLRDPAGFQVVAKIGRASDFREHMPEEIDKIANDIDAMGGDCRRRIETCSILLSNGGNMIAIDETGRILLCPYLRDYKLATIYDSLSYFKLIMSAKRTAPGATCCYPYGKTN